MEDSDSSIEFMEEDDKPPQAALGSFKGSLNKPKKNYLYDGSSWEEGFQDKLKFWLDFESWLI